ncbi:membrane protein [Desulfoplanes formicivorans]|uniref:Membrane protein n=2 Tax=Desulfoplanes formicivorans TaxID=1592317 RepID=A0A194AFT9_9BACT|nr:membrane protein [Desulfoplanes formicivorans]
MEKEIHEPGHDLYLGHEDPTIRLLHKIIRLAVKMLAVLMVFVIVWGIGDVIYVLYQRLTSPPFLLLQINDILATFGAFLAVLIAIEIFINISMYLSAHVIPVRLVIATALMAIARKVIIFDFESISPPYLYGTAGVILALGITYWLITRKTTPELCVRTDQRSSQEKGPAG